MDIYNGKSVSGGIAIGKISVIRKKENRVEPFSVSEPHKEKERFEASLDKAKAQLDNLYSAAREKVGKESAEIFEIHRMMLEDEDYIESVADKIENEHMNAEYAVYKTGQEFSEIFSSMDNEYMRGRSIDVTDISQRVIANLSGGDYDGTILDEPSIIVANDLTPSETIRLDKNNILAVVTTSGSAQSHTAILAGIMNIPAIVGADVDIERELDGHICAVDAYSGKIYIDPDNALLMPLRERIDEDRKRSARFENFRGRPTLTADGKKIMLYANIGSVEDADYAAKNDAEGIGLFRSEFLYLGRRNPPSESEQFDAYRSVISKMNGKPVIIRTFDIGADKKADFINLSDEENPALGIRGIRLNLKEEQLFRTQLRAIHRASAFGELLIMYPMITSVGEVRAARKISESVRNALIAENIPVGTVKEGIMIETPAAAMISDELSREVDFFSIGTNDLLQYTLAADRQNANLSDVYDEMHPAIFRLIEKVCESARKSGIWAGVCGELGGNEKAAEKFLKLGITELSVSPTKILPLREAISKFTSCED